LGEVENRISFFSEQGKKKTVEKVIELFQAFNNEIIALQNKAYKFCRFTKVYYWPLYSDQNGIIAEYQDGCWICAIKKDVVTEAQIQEFLQVCKQQKYKVRRMIMITFKQMELNVKLMALEKKIWLWGLNDLNLLFDLYGKEQIFG
ncbi:MAG: hypothetical protein JW714_02140, partial [Candidatus Omnitrophica bacterium]|nr:hypothetical protein [Candidatus Omnitrophota bacterium]